MRSHDNGYTTRAGPRSLQGRLNLGWVPLPALGHLAVGYAIAARTARSRVPAGRSLGLAFVFLVVVAVLPDLDIVAEEIGLAEHRGASHSLGLAAGVAGVVWAVARWRAQQPWLWSGATFLSMGSHGVLDLFSSGPGIKLLWPLTDALFAAPVRPLPTPQIFEILSIHGLVVLAAEALLFTPVLLWGWFAARSDSSPSGR